ncbi:hypothetical protein, partial [Listeria monocytogenes]|uniref:hypothetical protein n=1 Tax=Listeria monocytogenes TaxID=1639 RepID=UPI002FDC6A18
SLLWVESLSKAVAVGVNGKIAYSTDLDTWTQAGTPSFGSDFILAVAYDKLNQKTFAAGDAGKIASSTAYATTISAAVAGFSI